MEKSIKEQIIKAFKERDGFTNLNNIKIVDIDDNYSKLEVELSKKSMNPNGTAHGGLIFGLADTAMGVACVSSGRNTCTVNSQIDYLRPGVEGKLTAIAEPVKVGKTLSVYKCNIYDEKERLVASCTGTYYYIN